MSSGDNALATHHICSGEDQSGGLCGKDMDRLPRWIHSQVCVLQLVLWIRPMPHTRYNPAISQHQGGTAPLPTRRQGQATSSFEEPKIKWPTRVPTVHLMKCLLWFLLSMTCTSIWLNSVMILWVFTYFCVRFSNTIMPQWAKNTIFWEIPGGIWSFVKNMFSGYN